MNHQRRKLLTVMAGVAALGAAAPVAALLPTPRQSAGPFYPLDLPLDDDNDLTRIAGKTGQAGGIITDLQGRIVDINGNPLKDMRIEIWQCDINGRYRHPRENGPRAIDEYFQGHGSAQTDASGRYRFRTIRPVEYPGRTPHIHVAVFPDGERPFVTQMYIEGEERNASDFLYRNIPAEKRQLVSAEFITSSIDGSEQQAEFDIILNRRDGTPQDRS